MNRKNFGSKQLCKCLKKLEFTENRRKGSSHVKYSTNKKVETGARPFIVVIMGRKTYDPRTSRSYIRQIKNLGFSEEEITKHL